jgi:hypothetical protein
MEKQRQIEILSAVPDDARAGFAAISEQRSKEPLDGGWTPREILGHLMESAQVYDERVSRVVNEDNPFLLAYNQEEGVARANFNAADPAALLQSMSDSRARTTDLLRSLDDSAWERPGVHEEEGPITLTWLVQRMVDHESDHIADIRRAAAQP